MIDRLTQSSLKSFKLKFPFFDELEDQELFEHYINYIILEKRFDDRINEDALNAIHIGKNGTYGLDGFALFINKYLVTSIDDLNDILDNSNKPLAEVFFIQAKTENKFDTKEISSFGNSVEDFVSIEQKYKWNNSSLNFINLFKALVERSNELDAPPICHVYYCTLGTYSMDRNTEAEKNRVLNIIENQRVFSKIYFSYFDYNRIRDEYNKIGESISRTFVFRQKTLIPEIEGIKEAYIGVVPVTTIIDLIEQDSELIPSVFYDNVRDFQGFNRINSEMKSTISDDKWRYAFSVLNNGITIVANKLTTSRDNVTIENYQIINGLQTSRVLLDCKELLNNDIYVSLKLIVTEDEDIISRIIRATNSQTAVKEEDLIAYSVFQKKLEDFFKTFDEPNKLYYERRSKQYNNLDIHPKYIVDKSTLIKTIGSFYFMKPNLATRYFGALFKEFGKQLFKDDHKLYPYYTSAIIYNKLEGKFRSNDIDRKYKKLRYFILMMIRLEYKLDFPSFESKKIDKYCEGLIMDFEINLDKYISNSIIKIDSLNLNLSDSDLSKSSKLVDNIKELYFRE